MQPKFAVFDYNGTLVDDYKIGLESCNRLLSRLYNRPRVTLSRFRETFGTPWTDFYLLNGVKAEEIDMARHQEAYYAAANELQKEHLRLRPHAKSTLDCLDKRGIKLGVLSSGDLSHVCDGLKQTRIYGLFDAIVAEEHIHNAGVRAEKKTDQLIKDLGITNPTEVIYVGDMVQDVQIARAHGFIAGAITGGWQSEERLRAQNPDFLFNSYNDIKKLFE